MHGISEFLFWTCAALLVHVYAGYPLLMVLLARWAPRRTNPSEAFLPSVTLIISAHNEAAVIRTKLTNSLALVYPKDLLEILVISDCSDDGTDEIIAQHAELGVRLVRQPQHLGKSAGLNLGVPLARGQILVFSDANAVYRPDAIRLLVKHFADPRVGYVVGNARYLEDASILPSAHSEGLYWKLETWLKKKESAFYSVVGGDGAIYAIRRELFTPLLPTDINDLLNPLQIIDRGYLGVFEPAAISHEEAAGSFAKEFGRKVRIISRSLIALRRVPRVLNPFRAPRHWWMLVSHKILRWFAPVLLLLLLLTTLGLLASPFYLLAGVSQGIFYALALLGWATQRARLSTRILYLPYYFCLVNIAALRGIYGFLTGTIAPTWQTVRQGTTKREPSTEPVVERHV